VQYAEPVDACGQFFKEKMEKKMDDLFEPSKAASGVPAVDNITESIGVRSPPPFLHLGDVILRYQKGSYCTLF
jgi:hypothetical protein